MPNRLATATSPYLLQHKDNPVDWWPWGDEAFAEAGRRDVPVLLSVGYAACHWCHVMAHESFEDPAVAEVVNERFVAIKVDREERPDVDAVYLTATQAMTGSGGWPMTCFLTPAGEPFFCGTYFPPGRSVNLPAFGDVLDAVSRAWRERPDEVRRAAAGIVGQLAAASGPLPAGPAELDLAAAARSVLAAADRVRGGFGGAPKFPPSMVLEFLLRHHERTGSADALAVTELTCERMARGGLFDQLAGGFARYSTDASWVVPHFEKMLYDNALLLRVYAHLARRTDSTSAARIVESTVDFMLRELDTPDGGFASSVDADAAGREGSSYVWTPAQLAEVLGPADGQWAAQTFAVTTTGTFEDGASVLQLPADPQPAERDRLRGVTAALLAARDRRPQPGVDTKVITSWNGLAIGALAEAGGARSRPDWVAAAARTADAVLTRHLTGERLLRSSRDGVPGAAPAVLEDYACLADGLLALHQADPVEPARWLAAATGLLDAALDRFADPEQPGGYFDTAADAPGLVLRPRDPGDGATPSGASALAGALLTASALVGPDRAARYRDAAVAAVAAVGTLVDRQPRFAGHWLAVAEALAHGPVQVAVVTPAGPSPVAETLTGTARRDAPGGAIVLTGRPDLPGVPLLAGRPLLDGAPAAYVCHGYLCDRPVGTPGELAALLTPTR